MREKISRFQFFTEQILISLGRGGIARTLASTFSSKWSFNTSSRPSTPSHRRSRGIQFRVSEKYSVNIVDKESDEHFSERREFLELFISFFQVKRGKHTAAAETSEKAEWNFGEELTEGFRNVWQIPQYKRCRAALSFSFFGGGGMLLTFFSFFLLLNSRTFRQAWHERGFSVHFFIDSLKSALPQRDWCLVSCGRRRIFRCCIV